MHYGVSCLNERHEGPIRRAVLDIDTVPILPGLDLLRPAPLHSPLAESPQASKDVPLKVQRLLGTTEEETPGKLFSNRYKMRKDKRMASRLIS
jgi:hypothetical protein